MQRTFVVAWLATGRRPTRCRSPGAGISLAALAVGTAAYSVLVPWVSGAWLQRSADRVER